MGFATTQEDAMVGPLRFDYREPGKVPYTALCFPPGRHVDWTPQRMNPYMDELRLHGVHTMYRTNPKDANAEIVPKDKLRKQKRLGRDITLRYDDSILAEGVYKLQPGEAFVMIAGGCSVNVLSTITDAQTGGGLCVFHGGRESFINRIAVEFLQHRAALSIEKLGRRNVLDCARHRMHALGYLPKHMSYRTLFHLDARDFPHDVQHEDFTWYNPNLPIYLEEDLPDVPAIVKIDGVNHLSMEAVALGYAAKLGFEDAAVEQTLPLHGTTTFVASAQVDKRNLTIVYCPVN